MEKMFLSSQEVADLLGVPRKTIEREAREKRLPGTKIGRTWVFRLADIEDHIDQKIQASQNAPNTAAPKAGKRCTFVPPLDEI